jgi:hypothetical protein
MLKSTSILLGADHIFCGAEHYCLFRVVTVTTIKSLVTLTTGLSIYGDDNEFDYFGDEELFDNSKPSTSTQEAVLDSDPVNFLADLIKCQTNTLTKRKQVVTTKLRGVYAKPEIKQEASTSVSK